MNHTHRVLEEEHLDFLKEMMNIGIGNAAAALEQILQSQVEVRIPTVTILSALEMPDYFADPTFPVACAKMGMVGDVAGDLLFIVPADERTALIHLAEEAMPGTELTKRELAKTTEWDTSVLSELANILAGVYLAAIHEFSGLNLYHTVPVLSLDMIQAITDEPIAQWVSQNPLIILIENNLILKQEQVNAYFLFLMSVLTKEILSDAIQSARQKMCGQEG